MTTSQFELRGEMREVDSRAVATLDAALGAAMADSSGQPAAVMHALDPRRVLAFRSGGPPLWSVGVASQGDLHQFLTYGLSRAIDPTMPFAFELALRVRSVDGPPNWATLMLRTLARYQLSSGREIRPGQFWEMGAAISQAAVAPHDRHIMPNTAMDTLLVAPGPSLPTPAGPISIRNVFGLDPGERAMLECVPSATFLRELRELVDPTLTVWLDRPSLTEHAAFRARMELAAEREGTDVSATCVPGLRWRRVGSAFEVTIPAGTGARLRAMLAARLPFGRDLFVHSAATGPGTEMIVSPSPTLAATSDMGTLLLRMPAGAIQLQMLSNEPHVWTFR